MTSFNSCPSLTRCCIQFTARILPRLWSKARKYFFVLQLQSADHFIQVGTVTCRKCNVCKLRSLKTSQCLLPWWDESGRSLRPEDSETSAELPAWKSNSMVCPFHEQKLKNSSSDNSGGNSSSSLKTNAVCRTRLLVTDTFFKSETKILVLVVSPRFWRSGLSWTVPNTTTVNTDMFDFIVILLGINKGKKQHVCSLCGKQ